MERDVATAIFMGGQKLERTLRESSRGCRASRLTNRCEKICVNQPDKFTYASDTYARVVKNNGIIFM